MKSTINITETDDLSAKVMEGVTRAFRKLVETAAANNETLVTDDKDGNPKSVPAKEILKTLTK